MNIIRVMLVLFLISATKPGPASEATVTEVLKGHTKAVSLVAWAADGRTMATASDDRTIRLWNPGTGKQTASLSEIAREGYGGPVVAITADLQVAAVSYWGEIAIRNVADGRVLVKIDPVLDREQKSAFRPDVFAMAFSPDGKQLATAGSTAAVGGRHGLPGGIVIVWDTAALASPAGVTTIAFSPDGKSLAAGSKNGLVQIWSVPIEK